MMILLIDKSDSQFSLVQFSESLVWLQTEPLRPITIINPLNEKPS